LALLNDRKEFSGKLQEFSFILDIRRPLLRLFYSGNLPPKLSAEHFSASKVPLFSKKSHTDEWQMHCTRTASVGLLACKSPTLAIHNLQVPTVSARKALEGRNIKKVALEGDIFVFMAISLRRSDSGGGYFC